MKGPKPYPKRFFRPKSSGKPQQGDERAGVKIPRDRAIYGIHAVEAALSNPRRTILHAYFTENAFAKLGKYATGRAIETSLLQPAEFDALLGADTVHQGAALHVESLPQPRLEDFLAALPDGEGAALAMLDQVTDPHNVGAVLRSAAAFGIAALIVQERHSPPLTGTLAKAASGAVEHVPVLAEVNLSRSLASLKDFGFQCIGFDSDAGAPFVDAALEQSRIAFVFGAEDRGLRRLVREGCDAVYALSVPGKIKSLNVSNAAAIVFYEAARAGSGK
ncbi:MAG: 23S rRNA (guanosine(2251)-2'-O)-methyltransferase RlmB [Rhodomicrobium sp.]